MYNLFPPISPQLVFASLQLSSQKQTILKQTKYLRRRRRRRWGGGVFAPNLKLRLHRVRQKYLTIFRICPDRPWGPPSHLNGYRVFPGGKERPGRNTDPPPPSSAVGHERVELYLYSPYATEPVRARIPDS